MRCRGRRAPFVDIPGRDLWRTEIGNLRIGFHVRKLTNAV
jgi:hypothetical protein